MPRPHGRRNPTKEELAREIARRLSEATSPEPPSSWRDSVLVGRLISGAILAVFTIFVVGGIFIGVNWLLGPRDGLEPEVLSANVTSASSVPADEGQEMGEEVPSVFAQPTSPMSPIGLPTLPYVDDAGSDTAITIPAPTTSTTVGTGVLDPSSTTTTSTSAPGSTAPSVATTSSTSTVTTTTTTTVPTTTTMSPTTMPPTTSTTLPPSTTTTTTESTTTTCGNNGQGNGNC